jgi:tetratricopeptide (TPR) repeat protein
MNIIKRLGLIVAVALTMDAFVIAPAFAQQGEVVTLTEKVLELARAGKFVEAVPLAQRARAIAEKGFPPPPVATALLSLAVVYARLGRDADAELFKQSAAIREKALGPDHPSVTYALHTLAALYVELGRYADAEPLYTRSLAVREKVLGPDHPDS